MKKKFQPPLPPTEQHEIILFLKITNLSFSASGNNGLYPLSASLQFHIVLICIFCVSPFLCVCVCGFHWYVSPNRSH